MAVEARIRILEEQLADADPDPETDPDADADGEPQSGGVARTIVIIGSAVVLATGVALGVVGIRDFARVEGIQDGDAWSDFEDSHDRARPMMVTGAVLTVVGVAGLIVGALMKSRPDSNVAFDGQTMRVRW